MGRTVFSHGNGGCTCLDQWKSEGNGVACHPSPFSVTPPLVDCWRGVGGVEGFSRVAPCTVYVEGGV